MQVGSRAIAIQLRAAAGAATHSMHAYEVRPRSDKRGVDLISDALPIRSVESVLGTKATGSQSHSEK